jgi:hypothetical protein
MQTEQVAVQMPYHHIPQTKNEKCQEDVANKSFSH